MKKLICTICAAAISLCCVSVRAEGEAPELGIEAASALLMEADTGTVFYEMAADEQLPIASVTKIMTMLLICEAIDSGKITLDDDVPVSQNAMDMGGSTMFLETGDVIKVDEMLKGIAVASANDGCVAMAEFLEGSEAAFVEKMNKRAAELGMKNTHFVNTNGLDADGHYSSARDVALMSRELLKHEVIFNYTTIWTDTMRGGKFALANTNKLIRFYEGANGLKTGSTSKAKCCLSATAKRDGMQLIAVILGAPDSNKRFAGARAMLDYGFSAYKYESVVEEGAQMGYADVTLGCEKAVAGVASESYARLCPRGDSTEVKTECSFNKVKAPVTAKQKIGVIKITEAGKPVKEIDIVAAANVEKKSFGTVMLEVLSRLLL